MKDELRKIILENEGDRDDIYSDVVAFLESQWISVSEKMPNQGDDVLAFNSHNKDQEVLSVWDGRFCDESGSDWYHPDGRITHWQPLPEPPQ